MKVPQYTMVRMIVATLGWSVNEILKIHIYICLHLCYMCLYIVSTYVYMYMWLYVSVWMCMNMTMCKCVCVCSYMHVCMCVHASYCLMPMFCFSLQRYICDVTGSLKNSHWICLMVPVLLAVRMSWSTIGST